MLSTLMLMGCGTVVAERAASDTPMPSPAVVVAPSATIISSPTPTNTPQPKTIVAIGDSLVSGHNLAYGEGHESTIEGGWVTRLQNRLDDDYPGIYQTVNMGLNGRTVLGVKPVLPEAFARNPYIILIQVGGNDFDDSYSDETFLSVVEKFELRMREIIDLILKESPESSTYLVGETSYIKKYAELTFEFEIPEDQDLIDSRFKQFNDILEALAVEYGINYIDILTPWPEDVEERWELSVDGYHPNDDGFDLMTDIIYNALIANLD